MLAVSPAVWITAVVVGLFVAGLIVWSRVGLHRTLATMPALADEQVVTEARGLSVIHHTGGNPTMKRLPGAIVRVTDRRVLVSQTGLGSGDAMRVVILLGDAEAAMRQADPEALSRLGSFVVVRARPGEVRRGDGGTAIVPVDAVWPAVEPPFGPARWELPPPVADEIARICGA